MRFGSVCSGIEAASVAWGPLGWEAAWLSEIEPFPSAVLKYHYPTVPNLGDMTLLPDRIASGEVEAPDLFCGGTPCQAFSVAGLRKSLDDSRGNLSLVFCEIANAIDNVRRAANEQPAIIFWENVPGVLSTKDNAFGCFIAGLAGEENPVEPPRGKWTNAGVVLGPQRAVSWRILDAQYFGVAQRRRRVFVVASARNDFDPATVLFEFDGVRRDSAPSREAGKTTSGGAGDGIGIGGMSPVAGTLTANTGGMTRPAGNANELDFCVPISIHPHCIGRQPESGPQGKEYLLDGSAYCMDSRGQPQAVVQPIAFNARQDPDSWHDRTGPLDTDGSTQAVCITGEVTHTLKAEGFDASEDGTGRGQPIVPVALQDITGRDKAQNGKGWNDDGTSYTVDTHATQGVAQPVAFQQTADCLTAAYGTKWNGNASATNGSLFAAHAMAVRRLTPVECERLQGFPDGYTNIPWRGKAESPDGPRYKALGNSWAVPVVRWIGGRINGFVSKNPLS